MPKLAVWSRQFGAKKRKNQSSEPAFGAGFQRSGPLNFNPASGFTAGAFTQQEETPIFPPIYKQ